MALALYYVMRTDRGWVVRLDERDHGHPTLTSALRAAISAAHRSAEHGHEAQVLVQYPQGPWTVTWTSEDDFRPMVAEASAEGGNEPQ